MCQPNNSSMEETYKAEVECLRKILAEKDKEIKHLKDLLDNLAEEMQDNKTEILHKIIQTKVDPFLAIIQLSNIEKLREQAEQIRLEYEPFVNWEKSYERH